MAPYDDITEGLLKQRNAKYVGGTARKSYKDDNPKESPGVLAFLDGGPEPNPWPTTMMGQGLSLVERGRRALGAPPPPPPPPPQAGQLIEGVGYVSASVTDFGARGDGVTDDRAAIQAAIDSMPARGGVIYFPAGKYKVNAVSGIGLNLVNKDSLTLWGERALDFNSGTQGARLVAGSANMSLVSCTPSGNKQHGHRFHGINFDGGGQGGVKLANFANTNHWGFFDCSFIHGGPNGIGVEAAIVGQVPGGVLLDSNWSTIENCRFHYGGNTGTAGRALNFNPAGVVVTNCVFNLNGGMVGVYIALGSASSKIVDCYFVGGTGSTGYMIDCAGHDNMIRGASVENFDSPFNPAIRVTGHSNVLSENIIISGNVGIDFTSASRDNVLYGGTYHIGTPVRNSGTRNHIIDPGGVGILG